MNEEVTPRGNGGLSRREVLVGVLASAIGAGAGGGAVWAYSTSQAGSSDAGADAGAEGTAAPGEGRTGEGAAVDAQGKNQAGIARPSTPQRLGRLLVLDVGAGDPTGWLAELGSQIAAVTSALAGEPDGGDITVTVGLGPAVIASIDRSLPGAEQLPAFLGDDGIPAERNGGDVLLAAYASDPGVLRSTLHDLAALIPGAVVRWEQALFRGLGEGMRVRNPLGFQDGVIVPTTPAELDENVWIPDGPMAGGTICVIRRLTLHIDEFRGLPVADQERIIGRRRIDGAPLTGGGPDAEVALGARTPEGEPVIDAHAHVRAAHPSFTGSHLMLRRGYAFDDGEDDAGLMFICFQRDLRTFVATQHRLDELDALSAFSEPTASGTFVILPGFDAEHPLGSSLTR